MNKFKSFLKRIQPKAKYILGVLGIAAVVSQGAFAFNKLSAAGASFNSMSGDAPIIQGAKAPSTSWTPYPIAGTTSDLYQGMIYYHNSGDASALNTKIKVTGLTTTKNKTATIGAEISADNAQMVSKTVDSTGHIIGSPNLIVNLDQDANLALVPGSVVWYPGDGINKESRMIPSTLPKLSNGAIQTGDQITSTGIHIGDADGQIKVCWEWSGYVTFKFTATPIPVTAPALNIEKTVRNIPAVGDSGYVEQVNANANGIVEFKVAVDNTGTANAENLIIKDKLPAELTPVADSMKIYKNGSAVAENVSSDNADAVFHSGWNVGTLASGIAKHDILTFRASAPAAISTDNTGIVTNIAYATSGSLSDSDTAKVKLVATPVITPTVIITRNKSAENLSTGKFAIPFTNANGITTKLLQAKPGDLIEYTLTTGNIGTAAAEGFVAIDGINDILQEATFDSATNGGHVVNTTEIGDNARQIVFNPTRIAAETSVIDTFRVRIMNQLPANPTVGHDYDHKLFNLYGDRVLVTISIPTPPPVIPIPVTPVVVVSTPAVVTPTTLPRTGADSTSVAAIISVLLAGGSMLVVRRFV
ncbi:MAG: LPXTG cell wall anchor domain-containing protein [Candidatus Berkelbacteria bacterium]|nr:LPXTG cell wall anchor domain-containing protein [Candidatus Berkelbacteria bacterium]